MPEKGAKKTLALLKQFRTLGKTEAQLLGINLSGTVGKLRDDGYVIDTVRNGRQIVYHLKQLEPDLEYAEERKQKHEERRSTLLALMKGYYLPVEAVSLVVNTLQGLDREQFDKHHTDKPTQLRDMLWRAYEELHAAG
jgi:biotin operon repressor